jgi:hypothetical protein
VALARHALLIQIGVATARKFFEIYLVSVELGAVDARETDPASNRDAFSQKSSCWHTPRRCREGVLFADLGEGGLKVPVADQGNEALDVNMQRASFDDPCIAGSAELPLSPAPARSPARPLRSRRY